jgi:hypothetical protein
MRAAFRLPLGIESVSPAHDLCGQSAILEETEVELFPLRPVFEILDVEVVATQKHDLVLMYPFAMAVGGLVGGSQHLVFLVLTQSHQSVGVDVGRQLAPVGPRDDGEPGGSELRDPELADYECALADEGLVEGIERRQTFASEGDVATGVKLLKRARALPVGRERPFCQGLSRRASRGNQQWEAGEEGKGSLREHVRVSPSLCRLTYVCSGKADHLLRLFRGERSDVARSHDSAGALASTG